MTPEKPLSPCTVKPPGIPPVFKEPVFEKTPGAPEVFFVHNFPFIIARIKLPLLKIGARALASTISEMPSMGTVV